MEQLFSGALSAAQQWLESTPLSKSKKPDAGNTGASSEAGLSTSLQIKDKESRRAAKAARKAEKKEKKTKKAEKEAASQTAPICSSKKHKRDSQADGPTLAAEATADVTRQPNDESATEKRKKKKRKQAGGDETSSSPSHGTFSEPAKKKRKSDAADKDRPVQEDSAPTSSRPIPVPPSQRYSSGSQTFQRRSSERQPKMDDDQIRAKVRSPQGLNEFLCERWIDPTELRRLKDAGIINYKTGPFTETEKSAIRQHFEDFKRLNRLTQDELVDIIFAKGRTSERNNYGKFWPDTAAKLPGRPVKYVRDAAMRMYNPDGHKGAWTKEEDQKLRMAYDVHPQQWRKVAAVVERTETDCRDRWQKQLAGKEDRTSGFWSPQEVEQLVASIKRANEAVGQDAMSYEAPWEVVAKMMDGKRSSTACRKKWQSEIRALRLTERPKRKLKLKHKRILVDMLKGFGVEHERDINFARLNTGGLAGFSTSQVYQIWLRLKRHVDPHTTLAWPELLERVDARVEHLIRKHRKKVAAQAKEARALEAKAADEREKKAEKEKRKQEKQQEIEAKKKVYPSKEFLSSDEDELSSDDE